ncbi:hypothetical protein NHX12_008598 [Muraenolepis orangiensis]|uniref:ZP domain-containing protein n=1 Tax=Muraenolepis orangiensis TaxID=630683 RepID=A0A9Q0I9H4_9TELE|nr:hypothetical protein NHX12_008598 [Muraenolepis orangiensis]
MRSSELLLLVAFVFALCTALQSDAKSLWRKAAAAAAAEEKEDEEEVRRPERRRRPPRPSWGGSRGPPPPQSAADPPLPPLSWTYPKDPVPEARPRPPGFQLRRPSTADRVAVRCAEDTVDVEVSPDLLGLGRRPVRPEELTLGGCPATQADDDSGVLTFHSKLHGCNSQLIMTDVSFLYAFTLVYKPKFRRHPNIMRSLDTEVVVECHYPKTLLPG